MKFTFTALCIAVTTWSMANVLPAQEPSSGEASQADETKNAADNTSSPFRTWTSEGGRKAELALLYLGASYVQLKDKQNKQYNVPLDRLSDVDRAWVRQYEKEMRAKLLKALNSKVVAIAKDPNVDAGFACAWVLKYDPRNADAKQGLKKIKPVQLSRKEHFEHIQAAIRSFDVRVFADDWPKDVKGAELAELRILLDDDLVGPAVSTTMVTRDKNGKPERDKRYEMFIHRPALKASQVRAKHQATSSVVKKGYGTILYYGRIAVLVEDKEDRVIAVLAKPNQ